MISGMKNENMIESKVAWKIPLKRLFEIEPAQNAM